MCHWNAGSLGGGHRSRDARNDLDGNPCMSQHEHLFRAAAEHERVSPFQPYDVLALPGCTDHETVDGVLFDARPSGALAYAEALRARHTTQRFSVHEGVVQNQIGLFHAPQRTNGPELRITWTGSNQ